MNLMKKYFILSCFLFPIICFAQKNSTSINENIAELNVELDNYIHQLIDRQGIPGVSLAIVKDDKIIHKKNYGYANLEHQVPISDQSIFRVYSLTKPIISVGIFQLIEQGKLNLEDEVSKYLSDLPEAWNTIRIKHLLSHCSGLPDMAPIPDFQDLSEEEAKEKVFSQDIKFPPGSKYDYNQTGFWILQRIIEKIEGVSLSSFIFENQFDPSLDTAFFSSDSRDIIKHRATPYFPFAKGSLMIDHSYLQGTYAYAKNGLNITLDEFIKWDRKLSKNQLIKEASKNKMWEEFPYLFSKKRFAYGWDKRMVNQHISYGFSGSLVTAYRIFPKDNLSIIFLSNGLSYWYNIENIVNHIASLVEEDMTIVENYLFESLLQASIKKNLIDFKTEYFQIKNNPKFQDNNFERHLNDVGYILLNIKKYEKAIDIFKLNTAESPTSWNTYDSLAEAYEKNGNKEQSIVNYKKALKLNVEDQNNYNAKLKAKIEQLEK